MALALYRKYRSKSLDEIVGQSHVTDILRRAIDTDRIAHAYLFTGPRGVGKTSIARILAHEINGLPYNDESSSLDIIEIDAASNNGVDDIRDLRDKAQLAPVSAKKKIYIIDEVHMLSKAAFNALLKTLEEPPEHVVFILATTDADKLPDTIISRTQRHTFRRASLEDLVTNLKRITKKEHIPITPDAVQLIAQHADGSYRDSVSLLDQLANAASGGEKLTPELIEQSLGLARSETITMLVAAIRENNFSAAIDTLKQLERSGVQPKTIASQLIHILQKTDTLSPELLSLLDSLLDVASSSLPSAKLLVAVGEAIAPQPIPQKQHVAKATLVSTPSLRVPIPELAKLAEQPHPKEQTPTKEVATKQPIHGEIQLDWQKVLLGIKSDYIALYSVLEKCHAVSDGEVLRLYTKNGFYKKKLDHARFKAILQTELEKQAAVEWEIITIPSQAPPKDSRAAAVAAIMGGGEEVSIEDVS